MHKTLNYSIHWSKKHRQYESNKVNNTATKHSLCPGNGVCLTLTRRQATKRLCFNNNKNTTLKSTKNILKIKNVKKTCFLNFYKNHKNVFYIYADNVYTFALFV